MKRIALLALLGLCASACVMPTDGKRGLAKAGQWNAVGAAAPVMGVGR